MPSQLQRKRASFSDGSSFAKQDLLDSTVDFNSAPTVVVASELVKLGREIDEAPVIKPIPLSYERTELSIVRVLKIKLLRMVNSLIAFLSPKRKLSRKSRRALSQLRKLAHVTSASTALSPEEQILFDTAFGQAYYEILSYAKAHPEDDASHDEKYKSVMHSFVNSIM